MQQNKSPLKRIIVSVTNDLVTDQRVFKVCKTLGKLNFDILLIGRKFKNSPKIDRSYKTYRMRLLFNNGVLFYAEYNLRLFFKLLVSKKSVLLSNDLDTLLPNYLVSRIQNKKLVYDSHELFTEMPSVQNKFSQKIWRLLDQWLLPKLIYFYTVCDPISKWYEKKYSVKSEVIKNLPLRKNVKFKEPSEYYILYQGALNSGRGLIPLIKAMPFINNHITLKIAGQGPYKDKITKAILEYNLSDRIELLGNINPIDLVPITQNAIAGVSLEEDLGLSYRYSLPNKLFDYIQAKTPVISTYLPGIKNIVETYNVGEVIKDHSPENIAKTINKLLANGKTHYKKKLEKASKELIWENQEEDLLKIFRRV